MPKSTRSRQKWLVFQRFRNFNDVLRQLAELDDFRKLLGGSITTNRMQDAELVLRFLAFQERTYLNYSGAMKSFLNDFMNDFRNVSPEKAAHFEAIFKQAASLSFSVFGPNAFRKFSLGSKNNPSGGWESQLNRPLFDIVMWGFTRFEKNQVIAKSDAIRDALVDLVTNSSVFLDTITSAVGDKGKTQFRFEIWNDTLKEIISETPAKRYFDSGVRRRLFEENATCAICGQMIHTIDDAHVDHIVPFSKGGPTQEANAQLSHRFCNQSKSSLTPP